MKLKLVPNWYHKLISTYLIFQNCVLVLKNIFIFKTEQESLYYLYK